MRHGPAWGCLLLAGLASRAPESRAALGPETEMDAAAQDRLVRAAEAALALGPFSVMQKARVPPSGDRHDFLSLAPYWWPDPSRPDGLPYIRRDGEVNPESKRGTDDAAFDRMSSSVATLAEAYRATREERFAARAALQLRVWFLDPATKMNPNLNYGQAVPGRNQGRGAGIVATRRLVRVIDAVRVLAPSPAWSVSDRAGLQAWFAGYATWLRESRNGREEASAKNNHGTWYDAQLVALLLHTGRRDEARGVIETSAKQRIAAQIQADGRQPEELQRTRAWSYSVMNLDGWFTLARLADEVGIDLWHYRAEDGRSLRGALDYLVPFAEGTAPWPHPQLTPFGTDELVPLLRQAAVAWQSDRYAALADRLQSAALAGAERYRDPVFESVEVRRDIPFRTVRNQEGAEQQLRADVYLPKGDSVRKRPAILWIHGGGFKAGNDKTQKYVVAMAEEYAKRGYVSLAVDYRVRSNPAADRAGTLRDAVEDCRAALAWARRNSGAYGIDEHAIAVAGGSAGGMIAVNLAAVVQKQAAAGSDRLFAVIDLWGSPAAELRPQVASGYPPTVIVHGTADELVPYSNSEAFAAELTRAGVRTLLHPLKDARHTPTERLAEIVAVTARFVQAALPAEAGASLSVEAATRPGQPWMAFPTRTLDRLPARAATLDAPACRYGGNAATQLKASGVFRAEKVAGRWWLVDPDGHLFVSKGVVSVNMAKPAGAREAVAAKFGSDAAWAANTTAFLREHGFNNLGAWSDSERLRAVEQPLAYTRIWSFMASYGKKRGGTYQQAGHTGYPNDSIFVFDPEFETFADEYAKQLAQAKDDPWLLGHFSDNELPLKLSALKSYLALPAGDPGQVAAKAWLVERRGPNAAAAMVSDEDEQEFLFVVADRYFRIVSKAIRKYDPNHLYLGPRLHGNALRMPEIFRAAAAHVDVIAVNWYHAWTPDATLMGMWERESGRPCLVTEWYAKAVDSGMGNTSGAGWLVQTQRDRGRFYQNFALALLESRSCVGWQWFRYADNDPDDTSVDPSNRDANKGIVTNRYEPYAPLLDAMKSLNQRAYSLIEHFDRALSAAAGSI